MKVIGCFSLANLLFPIWQKREVIFKEISFARREILLGLETKSVFLLGSTSLVFEYNDKHKTSFKFIWDQ